jgi:hypothetical protein
MLYFPSWLIFMQNYETSYTSLNWVFVLFVLTVMYFRHYNVVLHVIKVVLYIFTRDRVYFPRLDICTFYKNSCVLLFMFWKSFLCKIIRDRVYFSKLDICTSFLPVFTSLHYNVVLIVMIFIFNSKLRGTAYFPKLNIVLLVLTGAYFLFLKSCTSWS